MKSNWVSTDHFKEILTSKDGAVFTGNISTEFNQILINLEH